MSEIGRGNAATGYVVPHGSGLSVNAVAEGLAPTVAEVCQMLL